MNVKDVADRGKFREWVRVGNGMLDSTRAKYGVRFGSEEIEEVYIPLLGSPADEKFDVLVKTADPALVGHLNELIRIGDTEGPQAASEFFAANLDVLQSQRTVEGRAVPLSEMDAAERKRIREAYPDFNYSWTVIEEGETPSNESGAIFVLLGLLCSAAAYKLLRLERAARSRPPPMPKSVPPPWPPHE